MALPPNLPKRGLSIDEAAEYCGVSRNTLLRHGPVPSKIGERKVFDRHALDRWLDALAHRGEDAPETDLQKAINDRARAVRHTAA